jgi:hypothetical protein
MELTQNIPKSLLFLLAMIAVVASAIRGGDQRQVARSSTSTSTSSFSSHSYIQHLHEQLAIDTSDPREDIRTNRILNMEGF